MQVLPLLALVALSGVVQGADILQTVYQWRAVDFVFPSSDVRQAMIQNGSFVPGNPIPLDVDTMVKNGRERTWVTIPRFSPGTPVTLATISDQKDGESPLLEPYPDWESNREGNCDGLTSVFRTMMDTCGRLWVLDCGTVEIIGPRRHICPPQIVVYEPATGRIERRHRFESSSILPQSLLVTIAVDVRDNCRNTFAYIADVTGYGMVVYDAQKDISWRVNSNYFHAYPKNGHFNINGDEFDLMDGVLGLALGPQQGNGDKTLYFHSMASVYESWVSTALLRNQSLFINGGNAAARQFFVSEEARPSQTAASVMDNNGMLLFNFLNQNTLNCWNSARPYTPRNLETLDKDDETFQFVSGLKLAPGNDGQQNVWALTSRFQRVMVGKMNKAEVNFRVFRAPLNQLVKGTSCAPPMRGQLNTYRRPGYRG